MTREELKKEAGEYASIHARQYCHNDANGLVSSYREVYNAYYQSAEPREKRIEELDKENGKLEGKLADLQSEYVELENFKNNEIKELKAQIEKMKNCFNCAKGNWENRAECLKSGCVNKDKWELKEDRW